MKFILVIMMFCISDTVLAQKIEKVNSNTKIYIVRHAEKQSGKDPLLTDEGNIRAGDLMRTLKNKKISRIYVTEYKRTQNTADSLRIQLAIDTVQVLADTSCISLFNAITKNHDWNKSILIINHSNIVPKIIYKLGVKTFSQENIPDAEFDNLYMVSFKKRKAVLKHSKYGKPSAASATMQ